MNHQYLIDKYITEVTMSPPESARKLVSQIIVFLDKVYDKTISSNRAFECKELADNLVDVIVE